MKKNLSMTDVRAEARFAGDLQPTQHPAPDEGRGRGSGSGSGRPRKRQVLLSAPRGFCAGVQRAIDSVEQALKAHGPPVYVRRQIVHNAHVVARLERMGAIFVAEAEQVPAGAVLVLSAHGVAPEVRTEASARGLRTIDATCPLVTKIHRETRRFAQAGNSVILIGELSPDEVAGTRGQAPGQVMVISEPADIARLEVPDPERVAWVSQSTLPVEFVAAMVSLLRQRFPALTSPPSEDICYAVSKPAERAQGHRRPQRSRARRGGAELPQLPEHGDGRAGRRCGGGPPDPVCGGVARRVARGNLDDRSVQRRVH